MFRPSLPGTSILTNYNFCKLEIVLKSKKTLANTFHFKDRIPEELISGVVYKFPYALYYESCYGECVRHLNVRIGKDIGISTLTMKKVNPMISAASYHLLLFTIFWKCLCAKQGKRAVFELKENFLIMKDKPFLSGNIRFAPIYPFHRV